MARTAARRLKRQPALTRDRIVRAAIELVDERGLAALSMRNLARRLGAGAMSLYNHVSSRDDLLDGIIEIVVREIHVPTPGTDWRAAMRQRAVSTRDAILRHPWLAPLIESQAVMGPTRLRALDAALGTLRRAGFSVEEAARAMLLMDSYIYGFTLQETSWRFDSTDSAAAADALKPHVDVDALPHLTELVTFFGGDSPRGRMDALNIEFERGFELVLDGLERLRGARRGTP